MDITSPRRKAETQPKPFKSDGCTMFPDLFWGSCCVEHDRAYWRGGTSAERREADLDFMVCVESKCREKGWGSFWSLLTSRFMYGGVRVFGFGLLPFPNARWGFGWKYPRTAGGKR